jgi:hypothetical protein
LRQYVVSDPNASSHTTPRSAARSGSNSSARAHVAVSGRRTRCSNRSPATGTGSIAWRPPSAITRSSDPVAPVAVTRSSEPGRHAVALHRLEAPVAVAVGLDVERRPAVPGGWCEIDVRPRRSPSSTPATLRSSAYTHVVGWPTPWAAVVETKWLSLPPVAATRAPRSSHDSQ